MKLIHNNYTVHSHIKFTHVTGDKMNVNMIHDTLIKQAQNK
jgi:hypothetical protein